MTTTVEHVNEAVPSTPTDEHVRWLADHGFTGLVIRYHERYGIEPSESFLALTERKYFDRYPPHPFGRVAKALVKSLS